MNAPCRMHLQDFSAESIRCTLSTGAIVPRTSLELSAVCQPTELVADRIMSIVDSHDWTHLDAALAYVVVGGVQALQERLRSSSPWASITKRFLVGIDWCRSQPAALAALHALPRSTVRIVEGRQLVERPGCVPTQTYHPKGFLFRGVRNGNPHSFGLLLGSANLSRNGLTRGCELDYWVSASDTGNPEDSAAIESLLAVASWFNDLWAVSTPLQRVIDEYTENYRLNQVSAAPATTADDIAPLSIRTRRGLSERSLNLLRSLDNFWIDTGSMYSNLGARRPGNQLDLKRFSRVFFGFPAIDLAENSPIGSITIVYRGYEHHDRHLRYGDNHMDKLDLPVPGVNAPRDYRNLTLCFQRSVSSQGLLLFDLEVGTGSERAAWRRRSRAAGGLFKMGGGSSREFGVF